MRPIKSVGLMGCVLAGCLVVLPARLGRAEDASTYIGQALGRVAGEVREINTRTNFGYDNGISLLGTFIRNGDTTAWRRELRGGQTYIFLGGGDDDARDVDLRLVDSNGRQVAADFDDDPTPFVKFVPAFDGWYTVELRLQQCKAPASFCAMAILRDGGWDVPAQNLLRAAVRFEGNCKRIGRVKFNDQRNQWCLFGSVLRSGEDVGVENVSLNDGRHTILAAGDDFADDLDLFLFDENNRVVGKDDAPDSQPVIQGKSTGAQRFTLRLKNARSRGASIIFATILDN